MNSGIEIGIDNAQALVKSGSAVIWVLCEPGPRARAMLGELSDRYIFCCPEDLLGDTDSLHAVGKKPVLVCEHGITSLRLAKHLRAMGMEAFSLKGGIRRPG
jgi:rhodanese-related sulfurtransferase